MDLLHDDAEVECPGSGTVGLKYENTTENGRRYYYFICEKCRTMLPYSPLKRHQVISRGNR